MNPQNCIQFFTLTIGKFKFYIAAFAIITFSAAAQAPLDVRIALVIGNSKYVNAPELVNPGNDARSISLILKRLGFEVISVNDGTKEEILSAVKKSQALLKGRNAVGMLYYAGHGLQQNWRNYIIPVEIQTGKGVDIPRDAVDIDIVLDAFKNASTRMNIIVLDACRDNPFGNNSVSKGLAQVDAPLNTYIAFATAPGNVARDGDEGARNGLFTGYMIKELQRPAPIEDMFKRVRLQVRKASSGAQIPWDSSSLEQDFYFNDGIKHSVVPSDIEKELSLSTVYVEATSPGKLNQSRLDSFDIQKSDWDKVRDSRNPNDFYEYLNKYPNGFISQEATFRLNQLSKIDIAAVPDKFGIVQSLSESRFRVGDLFSRRTIDEVTGKVISKSSTTVTRIEGGLVYLQSSSGKESIITESGSSLKVNNVEGVYTFDPPVPFQPVEQFQIGKKWTSESIESSKFGKKRRLDKFIIDRVEEVTVPAGTFKAFVVEREAFIGNRGSISTSQRATSWYVPGIGVPVKTTRHNVQNVLFQARERHEITELVEYKRGGGS